MGSFAIHSLSDSVEVFTTREVRSAVHLLEQRTLYSYYYIFPVNKAC